VRSKADVTRLGDVSGVLDDFERAVWIDMARSKVIPAFSEISLLANVRLARQNRRK
jgi:hypothetical protein